MSIIAISGKMQSGKNTVASIIQYLTVKAQGYDMTWEYWNKKHLVSDKGAEIYSKWKQVAFAGKLKQIASILLGISVENFEKEEVKNRVLGEEWWKEVRNSLGAAIKYTKEPVTVRQFLQELGTDAMRNVIHPNVWVNALFADYITICKDRCKKQTLGNPEQCTCEDECIEKPSNWIITDVRFPNELEAIEKRNGITIRINRNKFGFSDYEAAKNYLIEKRGGVKGFQSNDGYSIVHEANNVFEKENSHISETALDNHTFDYTISNNGTIEDLIIAVKEILIKEKLILI